jgi:hypothetical protein
MKHKETVDDEAIKMESNQQRYIKGDNMLEVEDPKEYARRKKIKSSMSGSDKKKKLREDREKNEKGRAAFIKRKGETKEDK